MRLVVLVVLAALFVVFARLALRADRFGFGVENGHVVSLMDFALLLAYTRAAWSGVLLEHGSVFSASAHLLVTSRWTGLPVESTLAFAYSPTVLWVLAPLCALPDRWAYVVWILAGLGAAGIVVARAPVHWIGLLAWVTPITVLALVTGQTALLSTAGLYFLMRGDVAAPDRWSRGVVLALLTAKAQLAFSAFAALTALRRWRTVALGLGIAALGALALTPFLGAGWWREYLTFIASYDRLKADPAFVHSVRTDQMSNLRAFLALDLGVADALATRVTGALWLGSVGAVVLATLRGRLSSCLAWPLALLLYLLVCPHVSPTEDVALFCPLVALPCDRTSGAVRGAVAALVVAGLWLTPALGPLQGVRPSFLLAVKVVLLGYVLAVHRGHRHDAV
jgi:hypothetical protein